MNEIDQDAHMAIQLNDGAYDTNRVHQDIHSEQISDSHKINNQESNKFELKSAGHPICCIATFGFKAAAIFR